VKLVHTEFLVQKGPFASSPEWDKLHADIQDAIQGVVWPEGSPKFLFDPSSKGRGRGEGNGVVPIKEAFCHLLSQRGWDLETKLAIAARRSPGPLDATNRLSDGRYFAVEWETGNISSSHRAVNKMALGMLRGVLAGGVLVLPTRLMYGFLTDRIGNYEELSPYFDLWKALPVNDGILAIIAVEHDGTDPKAPRIKKGTDGRALA